MSENQSEVQLLEQAASKPLPARVAIYLRLSGPGFLQSACTIGGGTLGASLFLGVMIGYQGLWIQPLAMILGLSMLTVIVYITLTTGEKPLGAINRHINPVLGWGWLIATIAANMIWGLPQYNLAAGALTQNVLPDLLGPGKALGGENGMLGMGIAAGIMACLAVTVIWFYKGQSKGVMIFEWMIKLIVALIVLCFFIMVVKLAMTGGLPIGKVLAGFVPDPMLMFRPADVYLPVLERCGDSAAYWQHRIVNTQRDNIYASIATAVGVNMTFLLPYSILARGWGRAHRTLAGFDLFTGLLLPFAIVTSCVVIVSGTVFHGHFDEKDIAHSFVEHGVDSGDAKYRANLIEVTESSLGAETWSSLDDAGKAVALDTASRADREMASMLVTRSDKDLSATLTQLFGPSVGSMVFGIGVFFIALSTVIIHMLINGYAVCEALGREQTGLTWRIGSLLPVVCVIGPFFWGDMAAYLVVPTSVIGLMMLPVAFWSFFLMLNSRSILGDACPRGGKGLLINIAVGAITVLFTVLSVWAMWGKAVTKGAVGRYGLIAALFLLLVAVIVAHFVTRARQSKRPEVIN